MPALTTTRRPFWQRPGGQTVGQVLAADAHAPETADLDRSQPGRSRRRPGGGQPDSQGASQLQVVTFGAPAVGNDAFNEAYGRRIRLDRIVIGRST